jgi:hypothetical protein
VVAAPAIPDATVAPRSRLGSAGIRPRPAPAEIQQALEAVGRIKIAIDAVRGEAMRRHPTRGSTRELGARDSALDRRRPLPKARRNRRPSISGDKSSRVPLRPSMSRTRAIGTVEPARSRSGTNRFRPPETPSAAAPLRAFASAIFSTRTRARQRPISGPRRRSLLRHSSRTSCRPRSSCWAPSEGSFSPRACGAKDSPTKRSFSLFPVTASRRERLPSLPSRGDQTMISFSLAIASRRHARSWSRRPFSWWRLLRAPTSRRRVLMERVERLESS